MARLKQSASSVGVRFGQTFRGDSHSSAPRRAILVTGLPGSGKTTLVNSSAFPRGVAAAVTFSDLMDEVSEGRPLRGLWPAERSRVQRSAAEKLLKFEPTKLLVIDGHLIIPTDRGWEPGVPPAVWQTLFFVSIVVIHVPVGELTERNASSTNESEVLSEEELRIRQNLVQSTAAYFAARLNRAPISRTSELDDETEPCVLKVIVNSKMRQASAESDLADLVANLAG